MTITMLKSTIRGFALSVILFAAAFTTSINASSDAFAQGLQCGSRNHMIKTLDKRFKEAPFAMGLASSVSLVEVFISKKGTWTILSTRANGMTCIIAAGKSWVNMPVRLKGDAVLFEQSK